MQRYIMKYCEQCGVETLHMPTTMSFVVDHVLKIITRHSWPSDRTPARYVCTACEHAEQADPSCRNSLFSGHAG